MSERRWLLQAAMDPIVGHVRWLIGKPNSLPFVCDLPIVLGDGEQRIDPSRFI